MKMAHPNKVAVRAKQGPVIQAIKRLSELGVEIQSVSFMQARPLIAVAYCPGVLYFNSECCGQGECQAGHYEKRRARLHGCDIVWQQGVHHGH